jgi:hypothetical protein
VLLGAPAFFMPLFTKCLEAAFSAGPGPLGPGPGGV